MPNEKRYAAQITTTAQAAAKVEGRPHRRAVHCAAALNDALTYLRDRGEPFRLLAIAGSPKRASEIVTEFPCRIIAERDEIGQLRALHEAGIYLSVDAGATADELLLLALEAGCWPVVPEYGVFPELLPPATSTRPLGSTVAEK